MQLFLGKWPIFFYPQYWLPLHRIRLSKPTLSFSSASSINKSRLLATRPQGANMYWQHMTNYCPVVSRSTTLQWCNNGRDGVSNHQAHHCLLNRLSRRRSTKISRLRVTGHCAGNSPVIGEFPAQMASNEENFPFDDVIMKSKITNGGNDAYHFTQYSAPFPFTEWQSPRPLSTLHFPVYKHIVAVGHTFYRSRIYLQHMTECRPVGLFWTG